MVFWYYFVDCNTLPCHHGICVLFVFACGGNTQLLCRSYLVTFLYIYWLFTHCVISIMLHLHVCIVWPYHILYIIRLVFLCVKSILLHTCIVQKHTLLSWIYRIQCLRPSYQCTEFQFKKTKTYICKWYISCKCTRMLTSCLIEWKGTKKRGKVSNYKIRNNSIERHMKHFTTCVNKQTMKTNA